MRARAATSGSAYPRASRSWVRAVAEEGLQHAWSRGPAPRRSGRPGPVRSATGSATGCCRAAGRRRLSSSAPCGARRTERQRRVAAAEVLQGVEHRGVEQPGDRRVPGRGAEVGEPGQATLGPVRCTQRVGPLRLPSAARRARSRSGSTTETRHRPLRAALLRHERDEGAGAAVGDQVAAGRAGAEGVHADPVDAGVTGDRAATSRGTRIVKGPRWPGARSPTGTWAPGRSSRVADGRLGGGGGRLGELVARGDRLGGDERGDVDVAPVLLRLFVTTPLIVITPAVGIVEGVSRSSSPRAGWASASSAAGLRAGAPRAPGQRADRQGRTAPGSSPSAPPGSSSPAHGRSGGRGSQPRCYPACRGPTGLPSPGSVRGTAQLN